MIAEFPNSYELQFSRCGTYLATYEYSNYDLDSVIFLIDDSSMTSYQLEGNNKFAYGNVGCPSGGSSCDIYSRRFFLRRSTLGYLQGFLMFIYVYLSD